MNVKGKHFRTIWVHPDDKRVIQIIDQRHLPHEFVIEELKKFDDFCTAIKDMHVRGAGLIGATAGYAMYNATLHAPKNGEFLPYVEDEGQRLIATRPTAVNLKWAVDRMVEAIQSVEDIEERINIAFKTANEIADEDADFCKKIGEHGVKLIEEVAKKKEGGTVNILTHCNAGWLAFVDYGSATAPIYEAFNRGIKIHVWVDETRPRNQGARLTAWELQQHGVPHTVIPDNVGGHLMQHGLVDMVITGTDRTTYTGDVANKIGTYLKALAAKDNDVPFYVALPSSTFDWEIKDGIKDIPIEQRDAEEVCKIWGLCDGVIKKVLLTPEESPAANYSFDVTPSRLVTALITERGIIDADEKSILSMYPEKEKMSEKGYIQFNCIWSKEDPLEKDDLEDLIRWNDTLKNIGLIGEYDTGIGFGNISKKADDDKFIISGSATGGFEKSTPEHFAIVESCDIDKNTVYCKGPIKASSESMSHAAIYNSNKDVNAVIHIHNREMWEKMLSSYPKTAKHIEAGTPEIAYDIMRIMKEKETIESGLIVMEGHEEGIMAFGKDLDEAGKKIIDVYKRFIQ